MTISFEKEKLFHAINLLSLLYQSPYYVIILLTVGIYPSTRNSTEGPLIRKVSELLLLLFSHK